MTALVSPDFSAIVPDLAYPRHRPVEPKVILVHDWLTGMRGGEKVLESLCERFPHAPLWTLLHVQGSVSETISSRSIRTSLLQRMPLAKTKYRQYLPLFPLFAELNRAPHADLVISTSHAVAKAMVRRHGNTPALHICYIHTPMRYAWDLFDEYFGVERMGWLVSHCFLEPLVRMLRTYDKTTTRRVDMFVANSHYVAERVHRLYGRHAEVLPPPVDTERFLAQAREPEDAYLVVSALVPYKRVSDAITACAMLGRRLKIVGKGPETETLKAQAAKLGADVDFVGFVRDEDLPRFYAQARALLFPGVEDFGIVPVEAIACGCPVIALGIGGVLDSMTADTAVLYECAGADGLQAAIQEFEAREWGFDPVCLRERARLFSKANFRDGFERLIEKASVQRSAAFLCH